MKKCEPWAVAAVYLMQSEKQKEHYTDISNYILETELTELTERGVATSRTVNERLGQKVIDGHAIFKPNGSGYYSLDDEDAIRHIEDIQDVIRCLKDKNLEVNLRSHKNTKKKPVETVEMLDSDDDLSDEALKLSEESRKLSDEAKKLSDVTRKLSDETLKLSEENKKLRQETRKLQAENQQLDDENKKLCQENQQVKEKLQSIRQLCD